MKRFAISALAGVSLLTLVAGCNNAETTRPSGPSVQEQVQKIESDPNMPPQAKAIAIQQLKARQGGETTTK